MRLMSAAVGSGVFFVVAPVVVAGVVPWLLTGWVAGDPAPAWPVRALGAVLVVAGLPVVVSAFARFVREGLGTPAPLAPTERLVVGGLYRHVRNPMYLAVLAIIAGQALLLGRPVLAAYGVVVGIAVVGFVRLYEEPTLLDTYGEDYRRYREAVPGWYPRLRAYDAQAGQPS
jgi:protein-S-isoprenylcysteine O-methyltransferase Ste14